MTLMNMFRKQEQSLFQRSLAKVITLSLFLVVGSNIQGQELITNGDFETGGLTGWTSSTTSSNPDFVANTGSYATSCPGFYASWSSPQAQIDGTTSAVNDKSVIGETQLISSLLTIPEACSELRFAMDLEYESLAALNANTQDLKVLAYDESMNSLGNIYVATGSGSSQIQSPPIGIRIGYNDMTTGSGTGSFLPLPGQTIQIAIESIANDDCFPFQIDNVSMVCQDPITAMDISVEDPCFCANPLNQLLQDGTYLFHDYLHVSTTPGLTLLLGANDGNLVDITNTAIPISTVFTEAAPGDYVLEFYTASGLSADIAVSSGFGLVQFTAGGCLFEECNDECPKTPACNDNIQLSLGNACEAEFDPNLILEGTIVECPFQVRIKTAYDVVVSSSTSNGGAFLHPIVDGSFIGARWKAEVYYLDDNDVEISCWGWFTVEDKLPPVLTCSDDITVSCKDNVEIDISALEALGLNENCESAKILIIRDELDDNDCGETAGISAERIVEYVAQDASGQLSDTCRYEILYQKINLADVDFPMNYTGECMDGSTPGLDLTGTPSVAGCGLSVTDNLCKFNISFTDDTTGTCGSNIKILRKWSVLDWCEAAHRQSYQTINIIDSSAPLLTCPPAVSVDVESGCFANPVFKPFDDSDTTKLLRAIDCSDLTAQVSYETSTGTVSALALGNNMFRASNLIAGTHTINYVITDECDNSAECSYELTIRDVIPPHAVCDQYTVVSLANNGWGRLRGISVDDGSYDQCGGPVDLEIRRLSSPCLLEDESDRDDTLFGPYVQFCCSEGGDTVRVELKVIDQGGLSSTCLVNVVVQDKYNSFNLGCPTPGTITASCTNSIAQLKNMYGSPSPSNTCGAIPTFISEDNDGALGECGVGVLMRTWTAVYGVDTTNATCVQRISVTKGSNLTINSFFPPVVDPEVNCTNWMEDLGDGPRLRNDNVCNDVGFTFEDNPFYNVEGYCVKVIRTWQAIDFCNYDVSTGAGSWQWTQTLKVSDTTGPIIDPETCTDTITVTSLAPSCDADLNVPMPSAVDACTGDAIDATGFSWAITGSSYNGIGNTANITLETGTYDFIWTATGICGSQASSTCRTVLVVRDDTKPTPYCRSSVTRVISLISSTGSPSADIWANDFNLGSDDCDKNLSISFSSTDRNDTQRIFECHQLGFHSLEIYFTDYSGNQAFCVASIDIQANGDICDTIGQRPLVRIEGDIYTEEENMVEDVEVGLERMSNSQMNLENTDIDGHFAFEDIDGTQDYRLEAAGAEDYLNGISTLDLVMIQRHILGLETLDSPYKLLAADVNGSEDINGLDLVELRKLILGIYTSFPQNESWRFVNATQDFEYPETPWPFQEKIELGQISQDMMENDFIAVKVGDVNGSAIVNSSQGKKIADNTGVRLMSEIHALTEPNQYLIPVYLDQKAAIYGLQMSLKLRDGAKIVGLEAGKLDINQGNAIQRDDQLFVSYSEEQLFDINPKEALFFLSVEASNDLTNNVLVLNETALAGEIYKEGYVIEKIGIGEQLPSFVAKLHQNKPNPFSEVTEFEFELPKSTFVKIKIMDLSGKIVKAIEGNYDKGKHTIILGRNNLVEDGVYYYQLETDNFAATRKMVRIN